MRVSRKMKIENCGPRSPKLRWAVFDVGPFMKNVSAPSCDEETKSSERKWIHKTKRIWAPRAFPPPLHHRLKHGCRCYCFPHFEAKAFCHIAVCRSTCSRVGDNGGDELFHFSPLFPFMNNRTHARHFYFLGIFLTQMPLSCETQAKIKGKMALSPPQLISVNFLWRPTCLATDKVCVRERETDPPRT